MEDLLHIVVPVYNEGANFPRLWQELSQNITVPFHAMVVYDFDGDDTVPVVQKVIDGGEKRIELVKNDIKRGVVGAIRAGFAKVANGPVLVVMADLSDDLAQVSKMMELYRAGNHVVAGSRYMTGGKLIGGPFLKQGFSRIAGVSLCWLRGVPTHDATNAFKIYYAEMLRTFTIESEGGFEINLELTVKAFLNGYKIAEVPSTWRDRTEGVSRFQMWRWMPRYLKWYFYAFRPRRSRG